MTDIRKLLDQFIEREIEMRSHHFLAPCVKGGQVRARVAGIVHTFKPKPRNFEGWGIFKPIDDRAATALEEADLPQILEYLQHFQPFRLRLACPLKNKTWLAYPVNEADFRQRLGKIKPFPVHLVSEGKIFEQIVARFDGQSWWFEELDRRCDLEICDRLNAAIEELTPLEDLHFKGITPEMRTTYELASQKIEDFSPPHRDGKRLKQALKMGGGNLQQFYDRGDYWTVEWTTADGEHHSSAISKNHLTVISSGICLDDRDSDFDLQSLVGVIEGQDDY
jgi:hypothetical protein